MVAKHTKTDGDQALAERSANERAAELSVGADLEGNPAYQSDIAALLSDLAVPQGYVETDIGFPPYWKADIARGFRGVILMRDERDPNFVRYHIENTGPKALECQKGPVDDGVVSDVKTGQIFTISAFGGLPLDRFFGLEVVVICTGSRKLPGNEKSKNVPRDLWEWKVLVAEDVEELLRSKRKEDMAHLRQIQAEAKRKALAEVATINAKRKELTQGNGNAINTTGVSA